MCKMRSHTNLQRICDETKSKNLFRRSSFTPDFSHKLRFNLFDSAIFSQLIAFCHFIKAVYPLKTVIINLKFFQTFSTVMNYFSSPYVQCKFTISISINLKATQGQNKNINFGRLQKCLYSKYLQREGIHPSLIIINDK